MTAVLLSLFAFVAGSVPTGQLIARTRGVDLRTVGSGNIGATNVLRTTGKGAALLTLLGDMAKGAVPVLAAQQLGSGVMVQGLIGLAAIFGHNFSVFQGFRGGKGVATSLGVLAVYAPLVALLTAIIWLATAGLTRYSSLSALVSFGAMPVLVGLIDAQEKLPVTCVMTVLLFSRHRENIMRLMKGTETKIGGKR